VLRPGGHFLVAVYDVPLRVVDMRDTICRSGFTLRRQEDITSQVRSAIAAFVRDGCRQLVMTHETVRRKQIYIDELLSIYSAKDIMNGTSSYLAFAFQRTAS
jgi:hypothetical protein